MRFLTALVTACCLMSPPAMAAPTARQGSEPTDAVRLDDLGQAMASVNARLEAGDLLGALLELRPVLERQDFDAAPAEARFSALSLAGKLELRVGEPERCVADLSEAGAIAPEGRDYEFWLYSAYCAGRSQNDAVLIEATITLVRDYPDEIEEWRPLVSPARNALNDIGDIARTKDLLEAMWAANYQPANIYGVNDYYWLDLLRIHAESGNDERAKTVAAALIRPSSLISLAVDNRIARFAPDDPVAAFTRRQTDELLHERMLVAEHPRELHAVYALTMDLHMAGQSEEALELLDAALEKVAAGTQKLPGFDDEAVQLPWIGYTRSRTLQVLGRWDEALAAQIGARDAAVAAGGDIISQSINLGVLYNDLGRPDDALAAISEITADSDYGAMDAEGIRACAYHQLGNADAVAKSLAVLMARADGYYALKMALLCTADTDSLAELIVSRLENPRFRAATLEDLQDYAEPAHAAPRVSQQQNLFASVKARPDVRAAIERNGSVFAWPVLEPWN
jgi:tetratricopeptide (TPR) repeat protein